MISITTKILGGISLALLIISLVGYSVLLNKDKTITALENNVKSLTVEVDVLKHRVEVCQRICQAEKEAKDYQQDKIEELKVRESGHLSTIDRLLHSPLNQQEEINEKTTITTDSSLPPDLIRVLDNVCQGVRGKACTNP